VGGVQIWETGALIAGGTQHRITMVFPASHDGHLYSCNEIMILWPRMRRSVIVVCVRIPFLFL